MGFMGMGFVVHVRRFGEIKIIATFLSEYLKVVCSKGIILELTLEISAVVCQLDSFDSVCRLPLYRSERCCQSVILQ